MQQSVLAESLGVLRSGISSTSIALWTRKGHNVTYEMGVLLVFRKLSVIETQPRSALPLSKRLNLHLGFIYVAASSIKEYGS